MRLSRTFRIANHLCDSIAITQIKEDQATMISSAIDPTGQRDLLPNILDIKLAACMCTIIYLKTHVKNTPSVSMITKNTHALSTLRKVHATVNLLSVRSYQSFT